MKDIKDEVCGRADDLIAFLYAELGAGDARKFERHLHECARCETEFASFAQIRKSIVSWRDESLGAAWLPDAAKDRNPASNRVRAGAQVRPSAAAAVREFFNLSPLWLKGAAAFASLLFCVCAVLAIGYLKDRRTNLVQTPPGTVYSKQDLDAAVAERVQVQIDAMRKQQQTTSDNSTVAGTTSPKKVGNGAASVLRTGYASNTRSLRKPLTRQERQELAVDLGLSAAYDQDDSDVVGDKINQAPQ